MITLVLHLASVFIRGRERTLRFTFAAFAAACFLVGCGNSTSSDTSSNGMPPNGNDVAIYRDGYGIPHIYAHTDENVYFGAGYALAQDNFDTILRVYLEAAGRAASVFGHSSVDSDFAALHWRIAEDARAAYASMPTEVASNYDAFIAGINRYIDEYDTAQIPDGFDLEPWMPIASTYSLVLLISVFQRDQAFEDCNLSNVSPQSFRSASMAPGPNEGPLLAASASNQWVIAPQRSEANATIVWADSHSSFASSRNELRLRTNALHVSGIVPAGMMTPLIGHNENVAWSFTVGGPDTSDCIDLKVNPNNANQYRREGEWVDFVTRQETIKVKGAPEVTRTLRYTDHNSRLNPVIFEDGEKAVAIASAYSGNADQSEATVFGMNKARNIDEFLSALSLLGMFPENVMAGDRFGEQVFISVGNVPVRAEGIDPSKPIDGSQFKHFWAGSHAITDLVQLRSPDIGWMQNTNISPDMMYSTPHIIAANYEDYIFNVPPGMTNERAERAIELLSENERVSIDDAISMGMDEHWHETIAWVAALQAVAPVIIEGDDSSPDEREFVQRLLTFDGNADKNSVSAANWYFWQRAVLSTSSDDRPIEALEETITKGAALSASQQERLRTAIEQATKTMIDRYGTTDVKLGDIFRVGRGDRDYPVGGVSLPNGLESRRSLRSMSCTLEDAKTCRLTRGQAHPMLTIFSDPIVSLSALPFGQSADPMSPHHSDQSILASEKQLKPTYFDWDALKQNIRSTTYLKRE